jgi:predicted nucleic acid-binding Zn ribbon protein
MREILFGVADGFFKSFLANSHGMKSKDQKRRETNQTRGTQPFEPGRELVTASQSLEHLFGEFNWNADLERASLFADWDQVVGPESANASFPEELKGTQLVVRCKSTAWATQMRLLEKQVLEKLAVVHPKLAVDEVLFIGPNAPSWKKGPRSVPGRGPRDTYG